MFTKVKPYMGGYIRYTYAALAAMFTGLIASAVPFFVVYRIIKPLLGGEKLSAGYFVTQIAIIFVCELAYAIFYVMGLKYSHISAYNTLKNIRLSLQSKLERQPLGTIHDMGNGKIKKLFTDDIDQVEQVEVLGEGQCDALLLAYCFVGHVEREALRDAAAIGVGLVVLNGVPYGNLCLGNFLSHLLGDVEQSLVGELLTVNVEGHGSGLGLQCDGACGGHVA